MAAVETRTLSAVQANTLFYGPYIGEFGHEIANVGLIRKLSRRYRRTVVCSRPDREALYSDFADEFVGHDIHCCGVCNMATPETQPTRREMQNWVRKGSDVTLVSSTPMDTRNGCRMVREEGEYVVYGRVRPEFAGAVVVHARWRPYASLRNWPVAQWNRLARWLFAEWGSRIICIGTVAHAVLVEGALDMRRAPLAEQMDVLRSARCAIGPSSGPMHLASMCKCPHLVWCGGEQGERRKTMGLYREGWNPHGTFVRTFECANWQPAYEAVVEHAQSFMKEVTA